MPRQRHDLAGTFDLPQLATAIATIEAGGLRFHGSAAGFRDGAPVNRLLFEHCADRPAGCCLERAGSPVPDGHQVEWTGLMIVELRIRLVHLCRPLPV